MNAPAGEPRPTGPGRPGGMAVAAVLVGVALLIAPRPGHAPTVPGVDGAYEYLVNRAAFSGQRFGSEFISTYGPLGYLVTGADAGPLAAVRGLVELARAAATGALAALAVALPGASLFRRLAVGLLLVYAVAVQAADFEWFALLLLLLLPSFRGPGPQGARYALAGALAGLLLLMKASLGWGALLTALVAGGLALGVRGAAVAVAAAAASAGAAWAALTGGTAGMAAYVRATWEVTAGYAVAMTIARPEPWPTALRLLAVVALLVLWARRSAHAGLARAVAVTVVPLLVAWKYALVRHDVPHVVPASLFVVFLVAAVAGPWSWARAGASSPWPVLALLAALPWDAGRLHPEGEGLWPRLRRPLRLPGAEAVRLLASHEARRRVAEQSAVNLGGLVLSSDVRALLDPGTVDVYPFDMGVVPANPALRWNLRPSPTSFGTYTPWLDERNRRHFESERRPDALVWVHRRLMSVDGRHALWDEPATLRAILDRYRMVAAPPGYFVLHAAGEPRFAAGWRETPPERVRWGDWIEVPNPPGPLLMRARLSRARAWRALDAAYRQPAVIVRVRLGPGGHEWELRALPYALAQGVWIDPLPRTPDQLGRFLERRPIGVRTEAVAFTSVPGTRGWLPIELSWLSLETRPRGDEAAKLGMGG